MKEKISNPKKVFLAIIFLAISVLTNSQQTYLRFRHLTQENGLKNCLVHSIVQDKRGFIWIGTDDGLFRYDGYRFKMFSSNPNDANSLNSNIIFSLLAQSDGKIWVGTYRGLMLYDESTEKFTDMELSERYLPDQTVPVNDLIETKDSEIWIGCQEIGILIFDKKTQTFNDAKASRFNRYLKNSTVNSILSDSKGNTWIGTNSKGVYKFLSGNNEPVYFDFSAYSNGKLNCNEILKIYESGTGEIWISTRGGGIFLLKNGTLVTNHFLHNASNSNSIGSNEVYNFWEDNTGSVWISTNGGGLNIYNRKTGNFLRIKHSPNDKYSLLNDNIREMFEDNQGNLWIASFQSGINIHINSPYQFNHFYFPPEENTEYRSSTVLSFLVDKDILWVGTDGGGLKKINRKTNSVVTYLPGNGSNNIPDRVVMTIYKDYQGIYWLGTYLGGLVRFNPENNAFKSFTYNPTDNFSISSNYVTAILEDTKGNFWIGTNGGGICLFDKKSQKFTRFLESVENSNKSIVDNYVNVICEDSDGDLWIGTYWGLSRFNVRDFSFRNYINSRDKNNSLSDNIVLAICRDTKGRIWIGTRMGLNLYNRETDSFKVYTENDGLAGNTINGILDDNQGNIWISTNNGITKFNPETGKALNYFAEDGLQGNEFYHGACYKSQAGELFFGGYNGFNVFLPDSVKTRSFDPGVIITSLKVLGNEIPIGKTTDGRTILTKSISRTNRLVLKYSDKSISLAFASIDYIEGTKNIYAYKLEGFEDNWKTTSNEYPIATYTNLNPGKYTLLVKAGKKEGLKNNNNITRLEITIKPPIWRTWWAFVIYSLMVIYMIYYFWSLSIERVKQKNQVKLEKLKREQAEESIQSRMRFYTNISHDIRTPLTLIIGPLEQMLSMGKEILPFRKKLDMMLKNARRLLRLIDQLLDFRKIEMQKMKLKAEEADIVKFIRDIMYSFEDYAVEKHIDFQFSSNVDNCVIWFDPDKMDKIMFNLLSNAFKYTPERGKISVGVKSKVKLQQKGNDNYVEITVSDTGKGIPQNELSYIFERFYQGHKFSGNVQEGWGLGLNLTKNYIELHKGEIQVESIEKAGSVFRVYLPMDDSYLSSDEKIDASEPGINKYLHVSADAYQSSCPHGREQVYRQNSFEVLIVEDNIDLRDYLIDELGEIYNCYEANNGSEGYEMAVEIMPDLVLSDVMMPGSSGIELCKNIKENIITSHIPVVLLTAKTTVEDQIEGYESGADAYVSKPFRPDQLIATINSILENRIRLKQKFGARLDLIKKSISNTADDKFLSKVTEIINTHLTNNQFGVNEMAGELAMSRVHLHRKMKAITNQGPNEYIRKIRLQKAAELLLKNELSITEICMKVGFSSTTYFSSCFKSYYQLTPREFIEKASR